MSEHYSEPREVIEMLEWIKDGVATVLFFIILYGSWFLLGHLTGLL
tara:strand:+ start:576 stop:713 length:138 start_codon:yes stop_codon:yes gene_type:complete